MWWKALRDVNFQKARPHEGDRPARRNRKRGDHGPSRYFFRHIYELNKGDQIQVRRSGRTFTFEVTGRKIVMPEDISVIKPTNNPQLTLITCYPTYYIGPAPKRLVVFSKLVNSDGQPVNQSAQAHSNGQ